MKGRMAVTFDEVCDLKPCASGLKFATKQLGGVAAWNAKPATMADLRAVGVPFDDLKWLAESLGGLNDDARRRFHLWHADCVAHVLHLYERNGKSTGPREAIVAARQLVRSEMTAYTNAAYANATHDLDTVYAGACAIVYATADVRAALEWQLDRLVAWFSDDEPKDWPLSVPAGSS
jgi:hypothetical protein